MINEQVREECKLLELPPNTTATPAQIQMSKEDV